MAPPPPLTLPGRYEARLNFGISATPFAPNAYRGMGPITLARQTFTISSLPVETAISVPMEPISTEEPFEVSFALPQGEKEHLKPGWKWRSHSIESAPEIAVSGATRDRGNGCKVDERVDGINSVDFRGSCVSPGHYQARSLLSLSCFRDICPDVVTGMAEFTSNHRLFPDPFSVRFDPGVTNIRTSYGDWDKPDECRAPNSDDNGPTLTFVTLDPPHETLDTLVVGLPFRVQAVFNEPPASHPDPLSYVGSDDKPASVALQVTQDPSIFLSDPITPKD